MTIIATIARSAGNESVGEMWKETGVFYDTQEISKIFDWAKLRCGANSLPTTNIVLSIAQMDSFAVKEETIE